MPAKTARKQPETAPALSVIPCSVPATEARDILGKLLNRAGFGGERILITDHGSVKAAIIGPKDLELLEQLDQNGRKNVAK